jgi:hypothetical protein
MASRQERFMASVKAGEVEKAYEELIKGSRFEKVEGRLKAFAAEAEKAIKALGEIRDWDSPGVLLQDRHQAFGTAILCGEDQPLYFYFVWYRKTETSRWVLLHTWFDDHVKEYWRSRN